MRLVTVWESAVAICWGVGTQNECHCGIWKQGFFQFQRQDIPLFEHKTRIYMNRPSVVTGTAFTAWREV